MVAFCHYEDEPTVIDSAVVEYHVRLSGSTLFYESQNKTQLVASIGNETAFLMISGRMTPMDCFASGWCIGNTICKWKPCFSCSESHIYGNISPDCMEMFHAGIRKCDPSHCEVCELDIGQVYGSDDSIEMFFNLQNIITFNIKRFVCLDYHISSQYVATFCTEIKKMICLEEVILDIECGSVEANAILDAVLACGTIVSLTLGKHLSEHFVKRSPLTDLTILSLSLYFSSNIDIKVTDIITHTIAMINFKSFNLAIHGYPFYIHGMLLEQLEKDSGQCSGSDAENLASYTSFPRNSSEIVAHLLEGTYNLILQNCGLGQRDTAIITQAVKDNKVLLTLDLSDNNCSRSQDDEVDPFADMLRVNQTLQVLKVCGSKVNTDSLFKVLADNDNSTLVTLDVRDNYYSVKNLQRLLMNNISLQYLQITVTSKCYLHVSDSVPAAEDDSNTRIRLRSSNVADIDGEFLDEHEETNIVTSGMIAAAYTDEGETIYSVCSALVTALSNNTTIRDLMMHTTDDLYYTLVHIVQECQGYGEVKERIKVINHDENTGKQIG